MKEDLKKRKGKGEKEENKKRVIKHTLKYLYEALMTAKNPQKQGRILEGGGIFSGWPEYIPLQFPQSNVFKSVVSNNLYALGANTKSTYK